MNVFSIINNIYTNQSSRWIIELENEDEISPFIIQEYLVLDDSIRTAVRFVDKYIFNIPVKMYLSLIWSIIPKRQKAPFLKWIPKVDSDEKWGFILLKIKKFMRLSDNDYKSLKMYLIKYIENDKYSWFSAFGIEKKYWKQHNLDFDKIKEYGRIIQQKGLKEYGM